MVSPARKHDNHSSSSSSGQEGAPIEQVLLAAPSVLDDELAILFLLTLPPEVLAAGLYEMGHRAGLEHIGRTMLAWEQAVGAGIPPWLRNVIRESQEALEQRQQEPATSEAVARLPESTSTPPSSPSSSPPLTKKPRKSYKTDKTAEDDPSPKEDSTDGESGVPECDPYCCYNIYGAGKDGCLSCKEVARQFFDGHCWKCDECHNYNPDEKDECLSCGYSRRFELVRQHPDVPSV
jgi:hypothetical protein